MFGSSLSASSSFRCVVVFALAGSSDMFSRAAFPVAPRKESAPVLHPPVDLDLAGPGHPCPTVVDDEAGGESCVPPDLAVSAGPLTQDALPPASMLSLTQEVLRRELVATAQFAFEVSAAAGAVRTHGATLWGIATKVTLKLGSQVLPMIT